MKRKSIIFCIIIVALCLSDCGKRTQNMAGLVETDKGKAKGNSGIETVGVAGHYSMADREFLEEEDNESFLEEEFQETLTEENFFDYEICTNDEGEKYAVINGLRKEYEGDFVKNWRRLRDNWESSFPEQLEGVAVTGFGDFAFQNIPLCEYSKWLTIPSNVVFIGEHCFENCGISNVNFWKENSEGDFSVSALTVGDGAFANNPELWGIYFDNRETTLGEAVFEGCAEKIYLCYRRGTEEQAEYLKQYALENKAYIVETPAYYSETPLVEYPETLLVLTPKVENFFYGENAIDEDSSLFAEYNDEAPDYGFPEWHIPCGEFCAMMEWTYDITASSELFSTDGRYAAKNLDSFYGREHAWAEGVEGNGIGESISIVSCCGYWYQQDWYPDGKMLLLDGDMKPDIYDGYMRYTEICVVNGYAKNQTVWEENGRVKRLLMYVEDVPYAYLKLEDTIYPQYFTLPMDAIKAADGVDIHFRFLIEDVYPGTKYEDTCLTGLVLDFMGRRQH